ncbi:MAG: hypothetical protein HC860_09360 [Alkalinema sp. RU_4_3]|nr:hypothetical protein [Alkalinema sp. RU_4_3]
MTSLLDPQQSYTFSRIFDLKIDTEDIVLEFGYTFARSQLQLPRYSGPIDRLADLRFRIDSILPYVSLSSETSRREVLIAQVIFEVIQITKAQLKIEYPLKVTDRLQGVLDYLLRSETEVLVIEAKKQDLDYGMTQLLTEMIALDQWDRSPDQPILIGAVTTGKIWEFAQLDRATKHFQQGLQSYRAPDDLEDILRILIQALMP